MKTLLLVAITTLLSATAFADGSSIRCTGKNAKGTTIGVDIFYSDVTKKISSISLWNSKSDGTSLISLEDLSTPQSFIRVNEKNELVVFGLSSLNDGLEDEIKIVWAKGARKVSELQTSSLDDSRAVSGFNCELTEY